VLSKLQAHIESGEPFPFDFMLHLLNEVGPSGWDAAERTAANEIIPTWGDYLPSHLLSDFIAAAISDEQALKAIEQRKKYIDRARRIVPEILRPLGVRDSNGLTYAIMIIEDCSNDAVLLARSKHSKIEHREIINGISRLTEQIEAVLQSLQKFGYHVDIQYKHHKEAYVRGERVEYTPLETLDQLSAELEILRFTSLAVLRRDQMGIDRLLTTGNMVRTQVVEYAYTATLNFGQPLFVTTPFSDFSLLCSLMYELGTGVRDQSFAGAIGSSQGARNGRN
jgi:hypothetical protein